MGAAGKKIAVVGVAIGVGLGAGVAHAAGFQTSMAEISTLVDTTTTDMGAMGETVRALSSQFGSMPTDTAKGFYQTISSGFGDANDAALVMTTGLKLAKGGVTDTVTAVDGLTSVLNAYGMKAADAGAVSDSLFTAVVKGRTTIGELAGSLGQVAPIAAATGVSMDEMNATVAALTLGGLKTSEAVTGLKGTLSSVLKPTSEATKLADQLGIQFNTTAIKTMGFSSWLADVAKKTGMSDEKLATLFGSVEGLSSVLALGGAGAENYAQTLEAMKNKSGAADVAFGKLAETTQFAFDQAKVNAAIALDRAMKGMLPSATALLNALSGVLKGLGGFSAAHPTLMKTAVYLAGLTAVMLVMVGVPLIMAASFGHMFMFVSTGLMNLGPAVLGALQTWNHFAYALQTLALPSLKAATTAAWNFAAALAANPITWIVVGVALAAAQIYLLVKHFDQVKAWLQKVPSWAITAFGAFLGPIAMVYAGAAHLIKQWDRVKTFFGGLANWWRTSGSGMVDAFFGGISSAWNRGLAWFHELVAKLRALLPGSDAREGPLRDLTRSGRMLPVTFAAGVKLGGPNLTDTVRGMVDAAVAEPISLGFDRVAAPSARRGSAGAGEARREGGPRADGRKIEIHVHNYKARMDEADIERVFRRTFIRMSAEA